MKQVLAGSGLLALAPGLMLAGSLTGTVLDRTTSVPIADAIVTMHVLIPDSVAYPDTSDALGGYAIDGIVTGNEIYVIMAGKSGYKPFYFRHDRIGEGSHSFNIEMDPDTASGGGGGEDSSEVTGRVLGRDRVSGELTPVPGAEVRLSSGGLLDKVLVAGPDGRFGSFTQPGAYAVIVSAEGYTTETSGGIMVGREGLTFGTVLEGSVTDVRSDTRQPDGFRLLGAYPNPFNPGTHVSFSLPGRVHVELTVHNLLGQTISTLAKGTFSGGRHSAYFDAAGLASGVYLFRLQAGGEVRISRAVLMR